MNSTVRVYGFGSYFRNDPNFADIDLLLLHENLHGASKTFVRLCKQSILATIADCHFTILSEEEEAGLDFIRVAKAMEIITLSSDRLADGVAALASAITLWRVQGDSMHGRRNEQGELSNECGRGPGGDIS